MPAVLTKAEFSRHLNTTFHLMLEPERQVDLELTEVKGYLGGPRDQTGMERFSLFFAGPGDVKLEQSTYRLQHDGMGEFEIFLVPIGRSEHGFRYEAVFNYFK